VIGNGINTQAVIGTVSNCTFRSMRGALIDNVGALDVEDSLFEDNNCFLFPCVKIRQFSSSQEYRVRPIVRNEFIRNNGENIVQIQASSTVIFSNNTMLDNTVRNAVYQAPLSFNGQLKGNYNYFVNPSCTYEVIVETFVNTPDNNLTLNYWGVTEENQVELKIYDIEENAIRARALYIPYLMSMDPNDLSPIKLPPPFLGPNSTISGVMSEDVHLTIDLSPYTVIGTATVDVGRNLTIDPGVIILFDASTSKI
jgi:hypothetical protein